MTGDELNNAQTALELERKSWEESALGAPLPPDTTIVPEQFAGIACEVVRCGTVDETRIIMHLHGGGFTSGSPITHRELAAYLSQAAGMPVLLVDYRLAPENPFPAGLDDCVSVYQQLVEGERYKPTQIVIGGDSAGAGLVVSTLLKLRDARSPSPAAAFLLSPWVDLALRGETLKTRAHLDTMVTEAALRDAASLYIGQRDATHPLISPIYADLSGLPPTLIHVGDHEVLLSDSTRLAERGVAAGVDVKLEVWPEMWHVWHFSASTVKAARQAVDGIGAFIAEKTGASRDEIPLQ